MKASCKADNFDQQITLDADGDESYYLTPYPINARNHVKLFRLGDIERRNSDANFSAQKIDILFIEIELIRLIR